MGEYFERWKKYFRFTQSEQKNVFVIILVFTFILGFDDGRKTFEMGPWFINLVGCFVIAAFGLFAHVAIRKLWGIVHGIQTEQSISWYGLGVGLLITFVSRGAIPLFFPGNFRPKHISTLRIGSFRHGLSEMTLGIVALGGPAGSILIAMFSKFVLFQIFGIESLWLDKFIFYNFLLAFYTMLPFPGQTGLMVFFGSRMMYAFSFGIILGYVVLFMMGVLSLLGAIAIGFLVWLGYYVFFEKSAW